MLHFALGIYGTLLALFLVYYCITNDPSKRVHFFAIILFGLLIAAVWVR